MSDKQLELYRTIQIDAGAVSYDLTRFKERIENGNIDPQTLLEGYDILISTVEELTILISKTAQLIFEK